MFEVPAGWDCRLLSRPRSILGVAWPRYFKAWFHGCPNTADGAWSFDSFTAGATALRLLEQEGVRGDIPHVCRFSDPDETAAASSPALVLFVWEGPQSEAWARHSLGARALFRPLPVLR